MEGRLETRTAGKFTNSLQSRPLKQLPAVTAAMHSQQLSAIESAWPVSTSKRRRMLPDLSIIPARRIHRVVIVYHRRFPICPIALRSSARPHAYDPRGAPRFA
ncbi:hypothetical protein [Burkholderia sp. Ac-20344]|uniref:hypothetical protein n=1 Tax=Burkholderia sp. Ac-20344 TaxID=2703890 RepID=UPI00197C8412|nr:hypothetical protein [Burkholderia sp. Ac-20344]MBN3831358.1 hypothetical protein [Burkholderia sp. Ac-20344]